jgi:hypothetical protein
VKRVEREAGALTMSAFSFPQFTHIHSKIFFTFTMKPMRTMSMAMMRFHEGRDSPMEYRSRQLDMAEMAQAF